MSKLAKYDKWELKMACDIIEAQLLNGGLDFDEEEPQDVAALVILWEAYQQFKPQILKEIRSR